MKRKHLVAATFGTATALVIGTAGLAGASPLSLVGLDKALPGGAVEDLQETLPKAGAPDLTSLDAATAKELVAALQGAAAQLQEQASGVPLAKTLQSAAQQIQQRVSGGQLAQGTGQLASVLEKAAQQIRQRASGDPVAQAADKLGSLLNKAAAQVRERGQLDTAMADQLIAALKARVQQLQAGGGALQNQLDGKVAQGAGKVAAVLESAAAKLSGLSSEQLSAGKVAAVLETAAAQVRERASIGPAAGGVEKVAALLEKAAAQVRAKGSTLSLSNGAEQLATALDGAAQQLRGGDLNAASVQSVVGQLRSTLTSLPIVGSISLG